MISFILGVACAVAGLIFINRLRRAKKGKESAKLISSNEMPATMIAHEKGKTLGMYLDILTTELTDIITAEAPLREFRDMARYRFPNGDLQTSLGVFKCFQLFVIDYSLSKFFSGDERPIIGKAILRKATDFYEDPSLVNSIATSMYKLFEDLGDALNTAEHGEPFNLIGDHFRQALISSGVELNDDLEDPFKVHLAMEYTSIINYTQERYHSYCSSVGRQYIPPASRRCAPQ